jgi:hypothetical protein
MSEIRIFKLTNGDELIATLVGGDNETYKISKVRQLVMQQTDKGLGMGLFPWLGSAIDNELDLYKNMLMLVPFSPDKNLEDSYLQQTTGIALAK